MSALQGVRFIGDPLDDMYNIKDVFFSIIWTLSSLYKAHEATHPKKRVYQE